MKKKIPLARLSSKALAKFDAYFNFFRDAFIQRDPIILRIKYAIVMKEHILLKGKPGTAKSDLAMAILKNIVGARVFKQQFTSFMDESYLFGPQILEELKKGNIMHNTKNSIVDCHFAFLDEFFNANEETIIAGNSLLNEREFIRNSQHEKSDIMTAIMTTNRSRENEDKLRPIYDRIIFNAVVSNVEGNRNKLYGLSKDRLTVPDEIKLTLEEIQEVQKFI
jgi:MoxR-like ATPase